VQNGAVKVERSEPRRGPTFTATVQTHTRNRSGDQPDLGRQRLGEPSRPESMASSKAVICAIFDQLRAFGLFWTIVARIGEMKTELWIEIIKAVPKALWPVGFGVLAYAISPKAVRSLLDRASTVEVAGVFKAEFQKKLDLATQDQPAVSPRDRRGLSGRLAVTENLLLGMTLLWIDDEPEGNKEEVAVFEQLGIEVIEALNVADAEKHLRRRLDLILSDIERPGESGLVVLQRLRELTLKLPVIFYVTKLDESKGCPPGAFGITNRVDELMHLVLDVVERSRR
jgi:CheY-like chemotaxis protein